jgi:ABC-type antimicrobial peptide transport system permease subunit
MALGAKRSMVVGLVMKQGLSLTAAGVVVGTLLSAGAAKAVSGALYGISAADPMTWIGATITLFAVAAVANAVPARRAAIVDPSSALRSE